MSDFRSRATPATKGPTAAQRAEHERIAAMLEAEGYLAQPDIEVPVTLKANPDLPPRFRRNQFLQERLEALQCALTRERVAMRQEPGQLASTANMRGASRQAVMAKAEGTKSKRAMGERFAKAFFGPLNNTEGKFAVVLITRIAPRLLDSDNLEASAKALRDGIATGLGINDRSSLVRYVVSQEQGEPRQHIVRAELFVEPNEAQREEAP